MFMNKMSMSQTCLYNISFPLTLLQLSDSRWLLGGVLVQTATSVACGAKYRILAY